jgi:hypothetical protein
VVGDISAMRTFLHEPIVGISEGLRDVL